MKLNKTIFRAFLLFGLFTLLSLLALFTNLRSSYCWSLFLGSLCLFAACLIKLWKFRRLDPLISPDHYLLTTTVFTENTIIFPNGYFFKWSGAKKNKSIEAGRVSEVNLNTSPPSFVLDGKEVVFVKYEYKKALEYFAISNMHPLVDRPEIWEMLCEPYLDTQFEEHHVGHTIQMLLENGLTEKEILEIRGKIKSLMLFRNAFAMEWAHLGQFDYLSWLLFLSKRKYWWTMEIALRNFK